MLSLTLRKPIIALCGTGGTGKTTVLNALADALQKADYPFAVFTSVSREYFALQGLAKEAEYKALELEDKSSFQAGMMQFYIKRLLEFIETHPDAKVLCDRSIFDHFAYWTLCGSVDWITYSHLYEAVKSYCAFVDRLFYFPYPSPFQASANVNDGFRDIDIGYNLAHSALVYTYANAALGDSGHDRRCLPPMLVDSVADRVKQITGQIGLG